VGRRPTSLAALAAGSVVLTCVAACAAFAWPASSPLVPTDAGRLSGDRMWAWLFLGAASAAFVAYALGLVAIGRSSRGVRAAAVLAAAIQLSPLAAPLLLSTDAWTYWMYGRIATALDGNPYRDTPAEFPSDAAFRHVGADWRDAHSVYGPAFTLASEPIAAAAGDSADAAAWTFKALAAGAVLVATGLAARLARRPAFAVAFVGWNPLLALHFGGGGHNDAWMAALVVGALVLGAGGRRQFAGVAWALAVLVKWIPLVLLPLRAAEARASGRRVGHLGLAAAAAGVAGLATWRYGLSWLTAFGPLARNANAETRFALPHRLGQLGLPQWLSVGLLLLAFAVAYGWLLRLAWRGHARLGLAAALLLLAVPYLAPWYLAWALPLAAADDDRLAQWLTLALTAYLLPQTVPI
jgi:Glycosyltransferase family 87